MLRPVTFDEIRLLRAGDTSCAKIECPPRKFVPVHPGVVRPCGCGPLVRLVGKSEISECRPCSSGAQVMPPVKEESRVALTCLPKSTAVSQARALEIGRLIEDQAVRVGGMLKDAFAQALRTAPLQVSQAPPWEQPGFRGMRQPQSAVVVVSTVAAATGPQGLFLRQAEAGYLGTGTITVTLVVPSGGTPSAVLSFQVPWDRYVADSFEFETCDQSFAKETQWTVDVNGKLQAGPFFALDGEVPLNVQARRGDTVNVNVILPSTAVCVLPVRLLLNGWSYPAPTLGDGTYSTVLRSSPGWPRGEN